jgi:predicted dehydrogenase
MLKVAIIGCGKIADAHAAQIQHIRGCELTAVCDPEELMAQQLFDRFPVKQLFTDVSKMLAEARPDVVHITTPPQSHLPLALQCLKAGCHVFVEKPFTLDTAEAEILLNAAQAAGRKVTVGHDAQFSDVNMRLRELVRGGFTGDRVVHMESVWCYDLGDVTYAKTLLDNNRHWSRTLPGGLLQNIISHGIAKIAEFLNDECPEVTARGFVSPLLRSMGETTLLDELRVTLVDSGGTSAYFTFSSQRRPATNQFHLYGSQNGVMIDEDRRLLVKLSGKNYKSYANHFIPPVVLARQFASNFFGNVGDFLKRKYHMDSGRRHLIEAFYQSIERDSPPPIPYGEILRVSKIMDEIFAQLNSSGELAPAKSVAVAPGELKAAG